MKIDNQTSFAVEALPFAGPDGKYFLTVVVKGTFRMPEAQEPAVPDDDPLPMTFGDEPFDKENGGSVKFESDLAPFKPRADVVLVGHAHAPAGKLAAAVDVTLRVGSLQKSLRVFGDRTWQAGGLMSVSPSRPLPFSKIPLVYERAFGGIDMAGGGFCPQNLVGCGFFAKPNKKNVANTPLPNIEAPGQSIRSPKDQPRPVGFGFYGRAWEPRSKFLGTYDENYRKNVAPLPPPDFKYDYYNAAHPDLQLSGYLNGDEAVELIHLSPDGPIRFQLPGVRPTCLVERDTGKLDTYLASQKQKRTAQGALPRQADGAESVVLNLDTLCLMPDDRRLFLLWRGRTAVYDQTAVGIDTVRIA